MGLQISIPTDVATVAGPWVGRIPSGHMDWGQMQPCVLLAEVIVLQGKWKGGIRLALPPRSAFLGSHCETMAACPIARTCKWGSPSSEGLLKPQESCFISRISFSCPLAEISHQIGHPFRNCLSTSVYEWFFSQIAVSYSDASGLTIMIQNCNF